MEGGNLDPQSSNNCLLYLVKESIPSHKSEELEGKSGTASAVIISRLKPRKKASHTVDTLQHVHGMITEDLRRGADLDTHKVLFKTYVHVPSDPCYGLL